MDPITQLSPPAIHGEAVAGRSASVRKQLTLLVGDIKESTFDLADLLFEAQESGYISSWGFENLGDFAEQELGLRERKAQYLVRITKVCRAVGLKRADYEKAGISKLREITTLDPEGTFWNIETKTSEPLDEHIVRLITEAEDMDREEVTDEVLRLKGMVGEDRPAVRSFTTTQSAWENTIKRAYERMRMKLGSSGRDESGMAKEYSDGVCVEMICAEWLAGEADEDAINSEIPMEEPNDPTSI